MSTIRQLARKDVAVLFVSTHDFSPLGSLNNAFEVILSAYPRSTSSIPGS